MVSNKFKIYKSRNCVLNEHVLAKRKKSPEITFTGIYLFSIVRKIVSKKTNPLGFSKKSVSFKIS